MKLKSDYWWKILIIAGSTLLTLAIHYGALESVLGHSSWAHAIHGRLCYIPIAMAAAWFGLRGGLWTALVISVSIQPYIFYFGRHVTNLSNELVEIFFYFAVAVLAGALVDRESRIRRKQEQTQLQLERSHKLSLIGQMAAGVAHEIKNPLASIKGAFEIINDVSIPPEEKKEFQEIVFKEISRINGTVKEFLEFARPRDFELRRINLSETVEAAVKQMQGQANKTGLKIDTKIKSGVHVLADREKMHQVVINLILNAIEASAPDCTIEIGLKVEGTEASMSFRDCGPGINNGHLERIFDPFFTTKSQGTGLGLAIVKSIVERHNGSIAVESGPIQGTAFIIKLPLDGET